MLFQPFTHSGHFLMMCVDAPMMEKGRSVHGNHNPPLLTPYPPPPLRPPLPRPSHDKVKMGCGVGCHSAWLSHRPHRMPFRVPQSNDRCVLLQREIGSERAPWMFLLNHAECVTVGYEDKRTKGKSAAQMLLLGLTAQVHRNNPVLLFTSQSKTIGAFLGEICPGIC